MTTPVHVFVKPGAPAIAAFARDLQVFHVPTSPRSRRFAVFKCCLWIVFVTVAFVLLDIRYYVEEDGFSTKFLLFSSLFATILILPGLWYLYMVFSATAISPVGENVTIVAPITEQQELHREASSSIPPGSGAPPSYRMLLSQDHKDVEVTKGSPPPAYDKAVT